jgi:hypothetical protein
MKKFLTPTTVLSVIIVILILVVGVLFWKYQNAKATDPAKETSARIIQKVAKLYMVPTNEEPTVAQIQDKSKLDNQEFFKTSENGDYLLIYQKAKVAIVYREQINKLVNVGPVNIGDQANQNQENQQGQTAGAQTEQSSESNESNE